jgi:hypothetical protein
MSSKLRSKPTFTVCRPRMVVRTSATCHLVMVVSRGEKKLRPKMSTVCPPWRELTSGSLVLASPGSSSLPYCTSSSLNRVGLKTEERDRFAVRVRTRLSPVCSSALVAPLFSLLAPVKFWWL